MKPIEPISIERLKALLVYDPQGGALSWQQRAGQNAWNAKHAGKPAMTTTHSEGYLIGKIEGRRVYAHRVAFAMHHGRWPTGLIDHINGDRSDNRIENIREVDHSDNAKNVRKSVKSSGTPCIWWIEGAQRWRVVVRRAGRRVCMGSFKHLDEAVTALKTFDPQGAGFRT